MGGLETKTKSCVKCGSTDRYKPRYGARFGNCRPCTLATQKKHRLVDPEKHNRHKREVRERDPIRARQLDAAWIDKNLERHMLIRTKTAAKRRGHAFNLELSDIIVPETCPLLGYKLERRTDGSRRKAPNTPSLDRIDSSKGYVKGNVWVISWRANHLKTDASLEELESIVRGLRMVGAHLMTAQIRKVGPILKKVAEEGWYGERARIEADSETDTEVDSEEIH